MILPMQMDRIPEALGAWLARRRAWNPIGTRVTLRINDSGDSMLVGRELHGVILATVSDEEGEPSKSLIKLHQEIDYVGHYSHRRIARVVTSPYLRWHRLNRLIVTSAAVRVIDAEDLETDTYERVIALALMRLDKDPAVAQ